MITTISDEVREHIEYNLTTESYQGLASIADEYPWKLSLDMSKVRQYHIDSAEKNLSILRRNMKAYDEREGPRVGDFLELPYGMMTRFTHAWDDGIQLGWGSFYLGEGYCSYSGSLEPSIPYEAILPTDKKEMGAVWFFHQGSSGGGRGVYFKAAFRVFKLSDSFDARKIWMVQNKERELYREKAETITRINGNGQPYTLPVPEILLLNIDDERVKKIEEVSGLSFERWSSGYRSQPLKFKELDAVKSCYEWKETFYNNSDYHNTLMLKFMFDKPKRRY